MGLNAKKTTAGGGSGFKQEAIQAAGYPGRVVQIIDLGMQNQRPYQGQAKPPAHEMMLTYELVDEFCLDEEGNVLEDKPRWLSETFPLYNLEADKAKSTLRYKALDPTVEKDGEFAELINTPCMVTVTRRDGKGDNAGKVYNNIGSISQMRANQAEQCPALVNPPKVFLLDEPCLETYGSLPQWLQDKIKGNLEFEGSVLEAALAGKPEGGKAEESASGSGDQSGTSGPSTGTQSGTTETTSTSPAGGEEW